MKLPKTFVPERDLEKKVERLLQGQTSLEYQSMEITISIDDDIFNALGQVILDYVPDQSDREKYFKDLKTAKAMYKEEIKKIFNADMDKLHDQKISE